jgi:ribonuclease HII
MEFPKKKIFLGIDEVGRGPIAGPVTIGIFVVEKKHLMKVYQKLQGITDSKKLTEAKRNYYKSIVDSLVQQGWCSYYIVSTGAEIIERKGISNAIKISIKRGLSNFSKELRNKGLVISDTYVFLDGGLRVPSEWNQETIIRGDSINWLISTASVIAKVYRDTKMLRLAKKFSGYHLDTHKGYGTKQHYQAIKQQGVSEIHRSSWIKNSKLES